jgi:hypothetical protein
MQVAVHITHELVHNPMTSNSNSHVSTEGQLGVKARGLGLKDGLAGGMERQLSVVDSPV